MKRVFFLLLFSTAGLPAMAQQIRVRPVVKGDAVVFKITEPYVNIEGYDGDEVIIDALPLGKPQLPAEAAGLTKLQLAGRAEPSPNTISPTIRETDEHSLYITLPPCNCNGLLVKVPKDLLVEVQVDVRRRESKLSISNIDNQVNVLGWSPEIELRHIAGFLLSTGGALFRSNYKVTISDVQWTDRAVTRPAWKKRMEYNVTAVSADIYLDIPRTLEALIGTSSTSGNTFSNFNLDPVPASDPDYQKGLSQFAKGDKVDVFRLNSKGTFQIKAFTSTGNIYLKTTD